MSVSLVEMLGLDLLSKVGNKIAELETENAKLRDQLRWRKWPEESPTETGYYIVWKFNLSYTPNGFYSVNSDSWDVMWKRFYWMPQMPLPEVES